MGTDILWENGPNYFFFPFSLLATTSAIWFLEDWKKITNLKAEEVAKNAIYIYTLTCQMQFYMRDGL